MRHFDALQLTRRELPISRHVPITHLNSPSVFEASNGRIGSVLHLKGVTFDTELDSELNRHKQLWHRALKALDERFCVQVTVHRRKVNQHLKGEFQNGFGKQLDKAYHTQFQNASMYVNDIYLTLIYKGITSGKAGKGLSVLKRLSEKALTSQRAAARAGQMKALGDALNQLKTSLSAFSPRVLGDDDLVLGYSELISFLGLPLNGGAGLKFKAGNFYPSLSNSIQHTKADALRYPEGNLSQYLSLKQVFFGECIQFQGSEHFDKRFGAIVTIKRYGTESVCLMLDTLLQLDCEFIHTNTFAIEAEDVALTRIKRQMMQKMNVNDAAVSQTGALVEARDSLASQYITMGYHHNTLMLISPTKADLEKRISEAVQCYSGAGMVAVKETIGLGPAFWAQVPTNLKYIARSSLITSENFVDFAPLHNYRSGYKDGNHLGSAVTLLETPSKTPVFFNYHVKGSKTNPSKGHALIIGGNNSGKTVLMTFLDAQMNRYGGKSFVFDRDRGAEIYVRAMGGSYAILSPAHPSETCFNPFDVPDTAKDRQFVREWLAQLCKRDGENNLDATLNEQLKACVDYAFLKLSREHRYLSNVVKLLPMDFPRWPELRRFLRGDGHRQCADGEYAYLFDNETDQLSLKTTAGFDMTHFLDKEPTHVRTALLMLLFHRIEAGLDGQRVSILLDEGWQYFIDPYWKSALERWLPTFRKKNAHLVLATQSPSSVVASPVRAQLLDNAATFIYFANPQAKTKDYIDGLGLTESEFACIAEHPPESRLFLVKQEHESCLCRLNLSHLPEYLAILSGNEASVRILDALREQYGNAPEGWLTPFIKSVTAKQFEVSHQGGAAKNVTTNIDVSDASENEIALKQSLGSLAKEQKTQAGEV